MRVGERAAHHEVVCLEACTDELVELCSQALPDELLTFDDIETVLFAGSDHAPGKAVAALEPPLVTAGGAVVLAVLDEGRPVAAAGATTTLVGDHVAAHLQILVVHPALRRRGLAAVLVEAVEQWARDRGSDTLTVGAGAPFFLFTGVDSRWTDALCTFEGLGYERFGVELDLVCPTTPGSTRRDPGSSGSSIANVACDADASELGAWARRAYPHWAAEFDRAAAAGTVVLARREGSLVGAAAHSVSRWGVIGPVAVLPDSQGTGVGADLLAAVLGDLSVSGLRQAEIAWTSTVRFYALACGARVGRCSVLLRRDLRASDPGADESSVG